MNYKFTSAVQLITFQPQLNSVKPICTVLSIHPIIRVQLSKLEKPIHKICVTQLFYFSLEGIQCLRYSHIHLTPCPIRGKNRKITARLPPVTTHFRKCFSQGA